VRNSATAADHYVMLGTLVLAAGLTVAAIAQRRSAPRSERRDQTHPQPAKVPSAPRSSAGRRAFQREHPYPSSERRNRRVSRLCRRSDRAAEARRTRRADEYAVALRCGRKRKGPNRVSPLHRSGRSFPTSNDKSAFYISKLRSHFPIPHREYVHATEVPRLPVTHLPVNPSDNGPIPAHNDLLGIKARVGIPAEPASPEGHYRCLALDPLPVRCGRCILKNSIVGQQ
jgi:hypothetical protein